MAWDVVDLDSLEGEGPGGMVRKVRRALGARAFGFDDREGRFVRVDPASRRVPVAGPDGLEFLTIGAPLDGNPYRPPDWG